jgi:hypothetical protein
MRNLLRVMGFWIWGVLAIGLAASVAQMATGGPPIFNRRS